MNLTLYVDWVINLLTLGYKKLANRKQIYCSTLLSKVINHGRGTRSAFDPRFLVPEPGPSNLLVWGQPCKPAAAVASGSLPSVMHAFVYSSGGETCKPCFPRQCYSTALVREKRARAVTRNTSCCRQRV